MLFETRQKVSKVSPALVETRDAFLNGNTRRAWELACEYRASRRVQAAGFEAANDAVLFIEIARASSVSKKYLSLSRMAVEAFPSNAACQLYYSRTLLSRGLHGDALNFLHASESTLGKAQPSLWALALAHTYADAGFAETSSRWVKRASSEQGFSSALGYYIRANAMVGLQRWDEAIALSKKCVAAAPRWVQARVQLVHSLLTRSQVDEAIQQWDLLKETKDEDASAQLMGGMLAFSLGDFNLARERLESYMEEWPQSDNRDWARRCLAILLVEQGKNGAARVVVGDDYEKLSLPEISAEPSGKPHKFIPVPLLAQNRNQCLPTTVAMATYPQGTSLNPDQLFREMNGREGTPLWRAWDWIVDHSFVPRAVQLEKEVAVAMIDAGVPLIGTTHGPFNAHVEVIMGYNEDMDVAYVRDPEHWAPIAWPWDILLKRYELCNGMLAVIDPNNTDALQRAEEFASEDFLSLVDLARAVAQGETSDAERAYARIEDNSPAAYMRDVEGLRVTLSPLAFRNRMEECVADANMNFVVRFRALMSLSSDKARELLEEHEQETDEGRTLGEGGKQFLKLLISMADGEWKLAQKLIDRLLRRGAGVASFWDIKSDIESELGNATASLEALSKAIELEPLRMAFREKWLQRNMHSLTFNEYLEEFEKLLATDPSDKYLMSGKAFALLSGPDGRAFESTARQCTQWFPRDPTMYTHLMDWYSSQDRSDMESVVLDEARKWMPDIFTDEDESSDQPSESNSGDTNTDVTGDSPLPENKEDLLALVWQTRDPRRNRALFEALKMAGENKLHWYEHARVVAARVLVPETDAEGKPKVKPDECLPLDFTGAPHWFAEIVTESVTELNSVNEIARAVYDWVGKVVPGYEAFPSVWFQCVLLLENMGEKELALSELEKMLKRYPANASALYRMAVVKYQQEDYRTSLEYVNQTLAINPGLQGGLQLKLRVLDVLDMQAERTATLQLMRKKVPYDFEYMREQIMLVVADQKHSQAVSQVRELADDFPNDRVELLLGRIDLERRKPNDAKKRLNAINTESASDSVFEDYLQLAFALASERGDAVETARLCDVGLKRWPDSTRLKEMKAGCIAESNPGEAANLIRDTILTGAPTANTVLQYLNLTPRPAGEVCVELVDASREEQRDIVMDLCDDAICQPSLMHFRKAFLQEMLKRFPDSSLLRWKLAGHCHLAGEVRLALKYANELYDNNPDEPEARRMLGRVLMDQDARKALPHLEAVCKKDRSVANLFDLARCYQLSGHTPTANKLHWEILDENPFVAASWTNLFMFGESKLKLWELLNPILRSGNGLQDEYFLVAAVKLACVKKDTLPLEWLPLAVERSKMLRTHSGFEDERKELKLALLAWFSVRPQDREGFTDLPKSWFGQLSAKFNWPRTKWVPRS